ncbi:hypothetical protein BD410DRAFT_842914 [Rickenella mellea]|uniref:Uncharacterized protein n=1 Tax=Rickenella mellea TaxID=50990 RepID=A0A4Y7PS91_9AGAM|nr:hypothetical protein BD410DRAFT_842914 [Rickenella mellea]
MNATDPASTAPLPPTPRVQYVASTGTSPGLDLPGAFPKSAMGESRTTGESTVWHHANGEECYGYGGRDRYSVRECDVREASIFPAWSATFRPKRRYKSTQQHLHHRLNSLKTFSTIHRQTHVLGHELSTSALKDLDIAAVTFVDHDTDLTHPRMHLVAFSTSLCFSQPSLDLHGQAIPAKPQSLGGAEAFTLLTATPDPSAASILQVRRTAPDGTHHVYRAWLAKIPSGDWAKVGEGEAFAMGMWNVQRNIWEDRVCDVLVWWKLKLERVGLTVIRKRRKLSPDIFRTSFTPKPLSALDFNHGFRA